MWLWKKADQPCFWVTYAVVRWIIVTGTSTVRHRNLNTITGATPTHDMFFHVLTNWRIYFVHWGEPRWRLKTCSRTSASVFARECSVCFIWSREMSYIATHRRVSGLTILQALSNCTAEIHLATLNSSFVMFDCKNWEANRFHVKLIIRSLAFE